MTDQDAVLALNQAFYRAFATQDYPAMEALWARRLPVACLHPGWPLLAGREAVLHSWRELMSQPQATAVHARNAVVQMYGDAALVLCEEMIGGGILAASNLFAREDGAWRLVHHQAGPLAPAAMRRPEPETETPPRRLH
jgi:ketosteroid isomerase-like protein